MGLKDWLIKKLEYELEPDAGHIDLEKLSIEDRKAAFDQFSEGDKNLRIFLETAYNHNAPSVFCCSGHNGLSQPYAVLKVKDESIDLIKKVGRVLSNFNVSTNFTDDFYRGLLVSFHPVHGLKSSEWFKTAVDVMENPEKYDDSNPSIFYHDNIRPSNIKPFALELKKRLLSYLRGNKKLEEANSKKDSINDNNQWHSWDLNEEENLNINEKTAIVNAKIIDENCKGKNVEDKTK